MKALVEAATLGTARREGPAATGWPVDQLLPAQTPSGEPLSAERRLLLLAGAGAAYRIAGALPTAATPLAAAVSDPRAPCSPAIAGLLRQLLDYKDEALLGEALQRLGAARLRLPHGLIPAFLDTPSARRIPGLRAAIGARGRWLASHRSDWSWARVEEEKDPAVPDRDGIVEDSAERMFQEGRLEQRQAALRTQRRSTPDTARRWLEDAWAKEKADVRAALLESLAVGLGSSDEPFLEAALDDRAATVRVVASRLLARMSGSALSKRMIERADATLEWEPGSSRRGFGGLIKAALGGSSKGKLDVKPPQALDRAWERDGITGKPPSWMGERAHWLALLLSRVPLTHWEQRFRARPGDLTSSVWASDWGLALVVGWTEAVTVYEAPGWAAALFDTLAAAPPNTPKPPMDEALVSLLPRMTPAELAPRVVAAIEGDDRSGISARLSMLPTPWAPEVARGYLKAALRQLSAGPTDRILVHQLPDAARAFPPETLADAAALLDLREQLEAALSRARFEACASIVHLRKRIHQEITP